MTDAKDTPAAALPGLLLERVPEIRGPMEQAEAFWAEYGVTPLGPDTVFGTVLAPYVIERLAIEESGSDDILQRIFAFLEELATSANNEVLSVVDVSLGESLLADSGAYERAKKYMGPRLRAALEFVLARWRELPPSHRFL